MQDKLEAEIRYLAVLYDAKFLNCICGMCKQFVDEEIKRVEKEITNDKIC